MKLKLDLHPICSDGHKIDLALQSIIEEACEKRAAEIEIIPGKGSGALKKSVLKFLQRPEIKARYHRLEKDSDNWGRLFVHFRWVPPVQTKTKATSGRPADNSAGALCFCCQSALNVKIDVAVLSHQAHALEAVCDSCGSPNRVALWLDRKDALYWRTEPGY